MWYGARKVCRASPWFSKITHKNFISLSLILCLLRNILNANSTTPDSVTEEELTWVEEGYPGGWK